MSNTIPCSTVNIRSVLQYVPSFRGKLFFVHISRSVLESSELVDTLLDLDVLHELGVQLVIAAEGMSAQKLYDNSVTYEMRSAYVAELLTEGAGPAERVRQILERGQIPIVATGHEGKCFPQELVESAIQLKAAKYIALMETASVPTRDGSPIHAILDSDVERITGALTSRDLLLEAADLCFRGIPRVHLLDGFRRGVLVEELFSEEGVGTMVHADSYREIRPLREDDIPELLSMIGRSVQNTDLVARSYEEVSERLKEYYVLTLDETIVGSVAVHLYPEQQSAELACLYIKHLHEGLGYGRALVAFSEQIAKSAGMKRIFAVSKSATDFFMNRAHFDEWPREQLPERRLLELEKSGRNSGVFGRVLS